MQSKSTTSASVSKRLVLKKERITSLSAKNSAQQSKDNTGMTSFLL
ncbi:hypothetical protein IEE83_16690 [Dyadobacter sp. UP-52]|uniref:Uncharacterized protein n=1 Tax=Dyadobacter subterraneus TaxID=2773304 RepID=A0ABR9WDG5_9BACT|nr:hypothetical protein [Dyadobacter subterraneus]